jgi:hypothetical protein
MSSVIVCGFHGRLLALARVWTGSVTAAHGRSRAREVCNERNI